MKITIHHLYISPGHNFFGRHEKGSLDHPTVEVDEVECVEGKGIRNDRFFDYKPDYKGQITFFDQAVYQRLTLEFSEKTFPPSAFRRNTIVEGIDLNTLIGKTFTIGDLTFTGSCEAKPCYWMDEAIAPGAEESLKGWGGLRARIVKGGILKRQDYQIHIV